MVNQAFKTGLIHFMWPQIAMSLIISNDCIKSSQLFSSLYKNFTLLTMADDLNFYLIKIKVSNCELSPLRAAYSICRTHRK